MREIKGIDLLNKAAKLKHGDKVPLFKGIYIIQERKLHDSGYRLMNVIGHTEYDEKIKDYKYYLISCCSDVIDFEPLLSNFLLGNYNMCDLHLDINKNGLIHIWTNSDKKLTCKYGLNLSSCSFEIT